ncbi:restriction endonuclease subunit S [Limnohabitans sp. DM1]|uniref:restriction endonuclease subunit S n=1 Tax=Limnohabitans sp. DM1 TaxID=1597955 RepID=UPI000B7CD156|nr:restriction endonuclease subunit S [Limnohabitans sp. DM1]
MPFVRATDIKDGRILMDALPHVAAEQPKSMEKCRLSGGELIIVRSGVNTGDCAVVPSELNGAYAAYDLIAVPNIRTISEYLCACLYTSFGRAQIDVVKNRAAQPHINANEVLALEVPDISLDFQRRLITELDAARAERDRAIETADELIHGFEPWALKTMGIKPSQPVRRNTFAIRIGRTKGRLDPFHYLPEFIEIERAITSAPHARLGDLVVFSDDTWSPSKHAESTFRYIEISGVDRRRGKAVANTITVADAPSRARLAVKPDDLIVSLTRPHHGSIALLGDEHKGCVASTGFSVIRNVANTTSKSFIWVVLRLSSSLQQMLRRASGGNYPAITQEELGNVLVPLPSLEIQQLIIDEATRRSAEADVLEARARQTWEHARKRFEQQLLKGEGA